MIVRLAQEVAPILPSLGRGPKRQKMALLADYQFTSLPGKAHRCHDSLKARCECRVSGVIWAELEPQSEGRQRGRI